MSNRNTDNKSEGNSGSNAVPRKDPWKGSYCYEYPRPSLTTDCVVFGFDGENLKVLLIERGLDPYKGYWALPGGFMRMDETIEQCARRELMEETHVDDIYLEQFKVFSRPDRDPRGRVVTVAFIALIRPQEVQVIGGDDAAQAAWFDVDMLPPLAFDHLDILDTARDHLKEMIKLRPIAFNLVEKEFTVDELRKVYEAVNGTTYDRRNFERKLIRTGIVEEVGSSPDVSRSMRRPHVSRDSEKPVIVEGKSPTDECCCFSLLEELQKETKAIKPRKSRFTRLFTLRKKEEKKEEDASDDEGSIKDLFNF